MGSRTWIKIYCDRWLNGSIRDETPELRGVWVDLLALAGSGKYGDSGEIKITDNVGYSDAQLADLLRISRQKWATMKKKLIETDRVMVKNLDRNGGVITQNLNTPGGVITKNSNIIVIKNWAKYQSEYERQKGYRHSETTNNPTTRNNNTKLQDKVTTKSPTGDRDKRLEKEIIEEEIRDTPLNPPISQFLPSETKGKESKQEESPVQFLPSEQVEGIREIRAQKLKEVIDLYQESILGSDTIPEDMEREVTGACNRYSTFWVSDAINESCAQGHPDWGYIAGILKNWSKYGKKTS